MKIVAKALLIDSDNNILVLRRSSTHPHFAHHLDFPGGEVEPGETEIDAVMREIREESGIELSAPSLNLAERALSPTGTLHLIFTGTLDAAQPAVTISWEHDQYEWLSQERLLAYEIPEGVDNYYTTVLRYLSNHSLH
jgi:8-oxo-dGTP diphosphatase